MSNPRALPEEAGVLLGDVLLRVDGQSFAGGTASVVRRLKPDQKAEISETRGGQAFSARVLVGECPRRRP